MTIQRYRISAFGLGIDVLNIKDEQGKYCLYTDVAEKIKIGEEAKQAVDKIQILLELSQRRELILMELLDERYKNENLQR